MRNEGIETETKLALKLEAQNDLHEAEEAEALVRSSTE
jgi:hypothetical protein